MPEALALQFFFNEGGGKFARSIAPFNTRPGDKRRLPLVGTDTNSYRRGSFDGVFHKGGEWYTSRGWGMGQATESDKPMDGIRLERGLPIMGPGATEVRHPRSFTDPKASFAEALDGKALAKYDGRTRKHDCSYGEVEGGHYYDCQGCLKRFYDQGLVGAAKNPAHGSVFVPTGDGNFGDERKAKGFFVDLERYTAFARKGGAVEDSDPLPHLKELFGLSLDPTPAHVAEVLRRGPEIKTSSRKVADELGLDAGVVENDVDAHIRARSQLPCSWMLVRIMYAGSGEQAFESLYDLLDIVGASKGKPLVVKHIAEACELRRKA